MGENGTLKVMANYNFNTPIDTYIEVTDDENEPQSSFTTSMYETERINYQNQLCRTGTICTEQVLKRPLDHQRVYCNPYVNNSSKHYGHRENQLCNNVLNRLDNNSKTNPTPMQKVDYRYNKPPPPYNERPPQYKEPPPPYPYATFHSMHSRNAQYITRDFQMYSAKQEFRNYLVAITRNMICIIYYKTKLNEHRHELSKIKRYYFRKCYKAVVKALIPRENNQAFMRKFLLYIMKSACSYYSFNSSYSELKLICEEMLCWTKQHMSNELNVAPLEHSTDIMRKHPSLSSQLSNTNTIPYTAQESEGTRNKCIFSEGPPGQKISISIEPSVLQNIEYNINDQCHQQDQSQRPQDICNRQCMPYYEASNNTQSRTPSTDNCRIQDYLEENTACSVPTINSSIDLEQPFFFSFDELAADFQNQFSNTILHEANIQQNQNFRS